jgi:hypothetical protein
MFEWLAFALDFDVVWAALYVSKQHLRRQMLWISLFTAFTGLTEPFFVPRYWNPPSLFNLASATHFDIESILFSWGTGGIGSVVYEAAVNVRHRKMASFEVQRERRWLHIFSLSVMPAVFGLLFFFTGLNPVYCVSAALFLGAVAAVACRPDLGWNTLLGGLLFLGLYFVLFFFIISVFPLFIWSWNFAALSGVLVLGVPLEELMFAFTFGMMWSGLFEHFRHYATNRVSPQANRSVRSAPLPFGRSTQVRIVTSESGH